MLYAVSLPAALVCVVLRFRSSRGVERQQLRWVAAGAAVAVAGLLAGALAAARLADAVAVLCVPVAVAVAVLRYRLWDLDRLVSRTVTYALVTGLLVLPYLLILPAATRLAGGSGSLAVAAATLAAAAAVPAAAPPGPGPGRPALQPPPLRRRPHRGGFAARLRDQVDLDALAPSCWPWSTRPCSRPGRRCGCAHRQPHGHAPNRSARSTDPPCQANTQDQAGSRQLTRNRSITKLTSAASRNVRPVDRQAGLCSNSIQVAQAADLGAVVGIVVDHRPEDPPGRPPFAQFVDRGASSASSVDSLQISP